MIATLLLAAELTISLKSVPFEVHDEAVRFVAFSSDDTKLYSAGDSQLFVSDSSSGAKEKGFEVSNPSAFSWNGKRIATADEEVRILSLPELSLQKKLSNIADIGLSSTDAVYSMALSNAGDKLAVSGFEDVMVIFNLAEGTRRAVRLNHGTVDRAAFSPKGDIVATGNVDGTVSIWDAAKGEERKVLEAFNKSCVALAYSPDGKLLSGASEDGTLKIWNTADWKEKGSASLPGGCFSVAFSPSSTQVAACYTIGKGKSRIELFSDTAKSLAKTGDLSEWVLSVAFSHDGKTLASGSEDGSLKLWSVRSGS